MGSDKAVYSAFLVEHNSGSDIGIEMDETGQCLGQLEDVKPSNEGKVVFSKEIEQLLEQLASEDPYKGVKTETKCLPSVDPINKLYKNPEEFYYTFFTKIKTLALNNISYGDSHYGNIIPNQDTTKEMLLIDFDGAELMTDTKTAAERSFQSLYNRLIMEDFLKLPALSKDSRELIEWFIQQSERLRIMLVQNKSLSHFLEPYLSKVFPMDAKTI